MSITSRLFIIGLGAVLVGIAGVVTTALMVPDPGSRFTGQEASAELMAIRSAQRCLENPIERLAIQKLTVQSLQRDLESTREAAANESTQRVTGEGIPSLTEHRAGDLGITNAPTFSAKVTAYSWFDIPVSHVSVSGSGRTPGNCRRV